MTRINLIEPKYLADSHAFAEWREIVRVPTLLRDSLKKKTVREIFQSIPKRYSMGTGHVKFFLDKQEFLMRRHIALTDELHLRGYALNESKTSEEIFQEGIDKQFFLGYNPDREETKENVERVLLRIEEKESFYKYYREPVETGFYRAIYKDFL